MCARTGENSRASDNIQERVNASPDDASPDNTLLAALDVTISQLTEVEQCRLETEGAVVGHNVH